MQQDRLIKVVDQWALLLRMDLLNLVDAFVQGAVDGRGDGKRTANDSAEADEEAGEGLVADFTVDDLHG